MKKKGFTLIELLAVIVILAIIVLIATPLVLKYIDNSNREALRNSIYSIDRAILLSSVNNKGDREYTSTDELDVKTKDTNIKISYVDGETRYYKVSNENYLLDVKKCEAKKYCTIEEIESIKNVIIHKSELFPNVVDNNPGIICGTGETEDTTLTTCHIRSIEDLVALSTLVNKGTTFKDKTVELVYSLDFNNSKSYASRKVDDSLINGEGFTPIGTSNKINFQGIFNGNDNTIKGLYIDRPESNFMGLFGYMYYGTINNLNIDTTNITGYQYTGSLIGYNNYGTVNNITMENINVVGNFKAKGGMIGHNNYGILSHISINNIKIKGSENSTGGLLGGNVSSEVSNVIATNITVECNGYCGGLIGSNSSKLSNIELENIEINNSKEDYVGSLTGSNTGSIENVKYANIEITSSKNGIGGLIGNNSLGVIKNVKGENIKVNSSKTALYVSGIIGWHVGDFSNAVVKNIQASGGNQISLIAGRNSGNLKNIKANGEITGNEYIGLASGYCDVCILNSISVKGNVVATGNNYNGGFCGGVLGKSETEVGNISGVYLDGSVTFAKNGHRGLGKYYNYIPNINILASSLITVNGSTVESNDPTSLNGKSLNDMGKVSQSEYEALGFEFKSTDTNEAYWYFNKDDELDLIIKQYKD